MPTPKPNESESHYMQRCMAFPEMLDKHPEPKQRAAICYSMYSEHKKKSKATSFTEAVLKLFKLPFN